MSQIFGSQIRSDTLTNTNVSPSAAIASTKLANWSANRDAGGNRLTNLADGAGATDAVTKQQLEAAVAAAAAGLTVKDPARAATTADLSATYNATGGASETGQITGAPNAVDGVALAEGDRVLVKDQGNAEENGIYVVNVLGSGSNGVWDRAADADSEAVLLPNSFLFVSEGLDQGDSQWVLTSDDPITVGGGSGTALTFAQFGGGLSYSADGTTLELAGSIFGIRAGGVGPTELASNAVESSKIASEAVTTGKIADGNVSTAKIADGAITNGKLGSAAVSGSKLLLPSTAVSGVVDGTNDEFSLSHEVAADTLTVFVNGLALEPGVGYTVSGTTITLSDAPETGSKVWIRGVRV